MPTSVAPGGRVDMASSTSSSSSLEGYVCAGKAASLRAASARHHITLRHQATPSLYHSLLLFSFPKTSGPAAAAAAAATVAVEDARESAAVSANESAPDEAPDAPARFYCMEAVCPHLGAPLENASIYDVDAEREGEEEDIEDAVIVCPWHEYDFSLSTGESSTGLKACVFDVKEEQDGSVWVQAPQADAREHDTSSSETPAWDVIEVRPVSEAACNGRDAAAHNIHKAMEDATLEPSHAQTAAAAAAAAAHSASVPDPEPLPRTLVEWAVLVLHTPEPHRKVEYTRRAAHAFRSGKCRGIGGGRWASADAKDSVKGKEVAREWTVKASEAPPLTPPRLSDAKVVQPGREGKRGKGGSEKSRIAMLHSLANIEQWAIDLAWDIIARAPRLYARTAPAGKTLPMQFFSDFVKVAEDEAKHFSLLQDRLQEMGAAFGDLPVHHGLWDSAQETMESLAARLCIIHLVHEARGLDANPLTIKKFENAGDTNSVEVLTTIHLDEVTHVSAGHRWLTYICGASEPPLAPVDVFRANVRQHFAGKLKGPFNAPDRTKAGLTREWYEDLVGEKVSVHPGGAPIVGAARAEIPGG